MGWFSDFVDDVADAVDDGLNAVGEFVSDVVEGVGNGVEDFCDWIGGDVPVWSQITGWIGSVISGVTDLVGSIVKGITEIIGGVIGGVIQVIGGILTWNWDRVKKGFGRIVASVLGAIFVIVLKIVGLVQTIIPIQARERKLTDEEIADMKRIFRNSLAYYNIRIIEGRAGIFSGSRELVVGNTIYMKDHDPTNERERLAHELVHVWQYQNNGSRYTADGVYASWFVDDEYSWEEEIDRGNTKWIDFNIEAQARLIQDIYLEGIIIKPAGSSHTKGEFFDSNEKQVGLFEFGNPKVDHTELANDTWKIIKEEWSQRLSGLLN